MRNLCSGPTRGIPRCAASLTRFLLRDFGGRPVWRSTPWYRPIDTLLESRTCVPQERPVRYGHSSFYAHRSRRIVRLLPLHSCCSIFDKTFGYLFLPYVWRLHANRYPAGHAGPEHSLKHQAKQRAMLSSNDQSTGWTHPCLSAVNSRLEKYGKPTIDPNLSISARTYSDKGSSKR